MTKKIDPSEYEPGEYVIVDMTPEVNDDSWPYPPEIFYDTVVSADPYSNFGEEYVGKTGQVLKRRYMPNTTNITGGLGNGDYLLEFESGERQWFYSLCLEGYLKKLGTIANHLGRQKIPAQKK